jgi:hypothetical protein
LCGRFCPYNPPYKPGKKTVPTPPASFLEDENIVQKSATMVERGIAIEFQPSLPIFEKMFPSSRKRRGVDVF